MRSACGAPQLSTALIRSSANTGLVGHLDVAGRMHAHLIRVAVQNPEEAYTHAAARKPARARILAVSASAAQSSCAAAGRPRFG